MRVIVCGGRKFNDRAWVYRVLDSLPIDELAHGAAPGGDTLADDWWLDRHGTPPNRFPANWARYGKHVAGPLRNAKMLALFRPDAVVAFPGGNGTEDMCSQAERAGVLVLQQV